MQNISVKETERCIHLGNWKPTYVEAGLQTRLVVVTILLLGLLSAALDAHGVSGKDALFLQSIRGAAVGPLMYLGA